MQKTWCVRYESLFQRNSMYFAIKTIVFVNFNRIDILHSNLDYNKIAKEILKMLLKMPNIDLNVKTIYVKY